MKKFFIILSLLACSFNADAQVSRIPERLELVQIEVNEGAVTLEVFNAPKEGQNHYYLSVGNLGIGDEVVQVIFDPVSELFLPLGDTIAEAMEMLQQLQELCKTPVGTSMEAQGCLALIAPNDKLETVKITHRKPLLSHMLEFSLEREGYIRATHISKSDLGSLVTSMKLYRKVHPKQQ